MGRLKVLLIIEQCNPDWPSVPLLAYHFFRALSTRADITLCTHERNKTGLEKKRESTDKIIYFSESQFSRLYYKCIFPFTHFQGPIWPLVHLLTYPIYAEFNRNVFSQFKKSVQQGDFDIVHAMTPIIPRYPVRMINACSKTPFILGPVNGGIPYPNGFKEIEKKEWAFLNFLRGFVKWIPGYTKTYQQADAVLVGSEYTMEYLIKTLNLSPSRVKLFPENGVEQAFFEKMPRVDDPAKVNLLFTGRLVPYKGADFLIHALKWLPHETLRKVHLSIVGDGEEKPNLIHLVQDYGLEDIVTFEGWISQEKITDWYRWADIFCFPSIREFGGAVILEAMAAGLPSIVTNYGGIGEYTTNETSIKITPRSQDHLIHEFTNAINFLVHNPSKRCAMSQAAIKRAQTFEWGRKADQLITLYEQLIQNSSF